MVILEHDGNTDMPTIHDLETPAVLIDMDRVERNIQQMQAVCDKHNVQFRPHIKTHKIPGLAQMQLDAGAVGIACQKTTEAEVFAEAGFTDIQLPYNIVGPAKTARLARLAKQVTITVTADSLPVIEGIAAAAADAGVTINVLAEIVGPNDRTGAIPENILELAQCVQGHDSLHFAGVMIYPSTPDVRPRLQATLKLLADHNIPVEQVSGGGSGAITTLGDMPELTELRVGTYLFWDWRSVTKGWTTLEQCAMRIRATVVSANDPSRVILDAGSKSVTADAQGGVHGHIIEYPAARLYQVNEEHGFVDFRDYGYMPEVGEVVHIIPVHTCVVTNLHDRLYGVRGDEIVTTFEVAARGRVW
jgi:D-serine deaminase-like pyridoxal phosphate-dependent protein